MIPATDYLKLLTDSTRTRPFDTRIDSYSTNLALAHSLLCMNLEQCTLLVEYFEKKPDSLVHIQQQFFFFKKKFCSKSHTAAEKMAIYKNVTGLREKKLITIFFRYSGTLIYLWEFFFVCLCLRMRSKLASSLFWQRVSY